MNSRQYRKAIEQLGLTQVAAARLLGVDPRTSRKWACKETDGVPEPVARFLKFILALDMTADDVRDRLGLK